MPCLTWTFQCGRGRQSTVHAGIRLLSGGLDFFDNMLSHWKYFRIFSDTLLLKNLGLWTVACNLPQTGIIAAF